MKRNDLTQYFIEFSHKMMKNSNMNEDNIISPDNVFQEAITTNRELLAEMMRKGHLEGSTILGAQNIKNLDTLAQNGKSCIVFCEHVSNLDVPSIFIRFKDYNEKSFIDIFDKFIFIAGLKLNQNPFVKMFAEIFSRLVIYPIRTIHNLELDPTKKEELDLSKKINFSATRKLMELKSKNKIFVLFPTGTRYRSWDPSSAKGMKETMAYLSIFENFCCCSISGNNMQVAKHEDMTNEKFEEDVLVLNFGEVTNSKEFIKKISEENKNCSDKNQLRQIQVDEIMKVIESLHKEGDTYRNKFLND